jgi:hypothetical protein
MEAYEGFMREVFHDDPNVRAFRTIVALREVVGPGLVGLQGQRQQTG